MTLRFLSMKFSSLFLAAVILLSSCGGNNAKKPDVSGISVNSHIERFDLDYFSLDSNNLGKGMNDLAKKYPYFINDFTANILGAGIQSDTNQVLKEANRRFFTSYYNVYQGLREDFNDLSSTEKELNGAFKNLKYYFPGYTVPRFISYLGPFDAPGVAITENAIAIGLQLYGGKDFPFYTSLPGQELFPTYISRRFEKSYIATNCIRAVAEDLFPDKSQGLPLIEQMIEKGKYAWLTNLVLPNTADTIKTGYTREQLEWCTSNEGVVWNLILQNDQLYSTDPSIIQMYIGDAPGTQNFPSAAPGNIGQWIGQRIIEAYMEKNPATTPQQLMEMPSRKIIDGAKYKPR
ncbi:hypothetical protein [Flavihumibacter fluvii]|uniref:gliding motility lipoprotein GldB n=1 Tax=Flavihumibacter fluvii TaxID=2838157 RepID=UPI001BDE26C7|nr:hypothetical protein [Flavihumibacter fluvii]ULQ51128.1 hypothetical protein KJS93_13650 [Flavihumibacter fluvii]